MRRQPAKRRTKPDRRNLPPIEPEKRRQGTLRNAPTRVVFGISLVSELLSAIDLTLCHPHGTETAEDSDWKNDTVWWVDNTARACVIVTLHSLMEHVMKTSLWAAGAELPEHSTWEDWKRQFKSITRTSLGDVKHYDAADRVRKLANCFKHQSGRAVTPSGRPNTRLIARIGAKFIDEHTCLISFKSLPVSDYINRVGDFLSRMVDEIRQACCPIAAHAARIP